MHIERFFVPGLAHASYLVASESEAVVIDPERNVDGYLAYLGQHQLGAEGHLFDTSARRFCSWACGAVFAIGRSCPGF